jgi:hypothetical protein
MPVYRLFAVFAALLVAPYAYVAYWLYTCGKCQFTGHGLLATMGLLMAAPYALGAIALGALLAGGWGLWRAVQSARPGSAVFGVVLLLSGLWLGSNMLRFPALMAKQMAAADRSKNLFAQRSRGDTVIEQQPRHKRRLDAEKRRREENERRRP